MVVGINGSPNKDGTTVMMLKKFLSSAEQHGGMTRLVHLADSKINPCRGCYSKDPKLCKFPCVQKDDMQKYPISSLPQS